MKNRLEMLDSHVFQKKIEPVTDVWESMNLDSHMSEKAI